MVTDLGAAPKLGEVEKETDTASSSSAPSHGWGGRCGVAHPTLHNEQ